MSVLPAPMWAQVHYYPHISCFCKFNPPLKGQQRAINSLKPFVIRYLVITQGPKTKAREIPCAQLPYILCSFFVILPRKDREVLIKWHHSFPFSNSWISDVEAMKQWKHHMENADNKEETLSLRQAREGDFHVPALLLGALNPGKAAWETWLRAGFFP
jgi:hypothetical protein